MSDPQDASGFSRGDDASASPLSQDEIEALLRSLQRSQGGPVPPDAPGADEAGPWGPIGETLAVVLCALVERAWSRRQPNVAVRRADKVPQPVPNAAEALVVRLGPPLHQRLWCFWQVGDGLGDIAGDLVTEIEATLPTPSTRQALSEETALPDGALLLPFHAEWPGGEAILTLGVESGPPLRRLQDRLVRAVQAVSAAETQVVVDGTGERLQLAAVDVEVAVYVGGGVYPLGELAALGSGSVLTLQTPVGRPAVLAIQGRVVALGEVMTTPGDGLAVRITRVLLGDEGRRAIPEWLVGGDAEPREPAGSGL